MRSCGLWPLLLFFFSLWLVPGLTHADTAPPSYLELQFNGLPSAIKTVLSQGLNTPDYVTSPDMPKAAVQRIVQYSYQEITTILKSEGYFHAKVRRSALEKKRSKIWLAIYDIDLGPRVIIQDVKISMTGQGADEEALFDIVHEHPLQAGKPFTQSHYNAIKSELIDTANNLGYFDANLTETRIEIDEKANKAWIIIAMETGEDYSIGAITLTPDKPIFKTSFLNKFLSIHSGENYNAQDVQDTYNELLKTNYFDAIHIEPISDPITKKVNITITLNVKKSQQYTFGLGYGTESGPRTLLGFQQRYLTSTGHYFTGQAQLSTTFYRFSAFYVIPGKDPRTDSHRLGGSRGSIDVVPYIARETSAGYTFLQHTENWEISLGLNQYFVEYTENSILQGHNKYLLPQVAVSYYILDAEKHWNDGFAMSLDLTGTAKNSQVSDITFIKNTVNLKYSYGINPNNRLLFGSTVGILGVSHIQDIAPTLRFYAGGVGSVRGYSYKSLGPKEGNYLVGGKYLLTANINYERYLLHQVSGVVFYDVGNAYNAFKSFTIYQGTGVGLNWHSPIGPLKFYLSKALSLPGDHWRFDLSIGAFL